MGVMGEQGGVKTNRVLFIDVNNMLQELDEISTLNFYTVRKWLIKKYATDVKEIKSESELDIVPESKTIYMVLRVAEPRLMYKIWSLTRVEGSWFSRASATKVYLGYVTILPYTTYPVFTDGDYGYYTNIPNIADGMAVFEIQDWRYSEPEYVDSRNALHVNNNKCPFAIGERTIVTRDEFVDRMWKYTDNLQLINFGNWDGVVMAGGFLTRLLRPELDMQGADIDLFVYGRNQKKTVDRLLTYYYNYAMGRNMEFVTEVYHSVLNIKIGDKIMIQVICFNRKSPLDVVKGFVGFEVYNQFWYDGQELYTTGDCFYYTNKMTVPFKVRKNSRPWRLLKAWDSGFHIEFDLNNLPKDLTVNEDGTNTFAEWLESYGKADKPVFRYMSIHGIQSVLDSLNYYGSVSRSYE